MSALVGVIAFVTIALSFGLTFMMRQISLARGLIDVPNARSSHTIPTPRGGGVAIVLASIGAMCLLWFLGIVDRGLFMALVVGGLAVATIGFVDDRRPLSARSRLIVHFAAAAWALAWLGWMPDAQLAGVLFIEKTAASLAAVFGIVWVLNLYNFMDGIDGIAAAEAVVVAWGGACLLLVAGHANGVVAAAIVFGAACGGFLLWNWPPAKIFMGDVGSGYLGYVIAVLALAASRGSSASLWTWFILGGVFFVDATVTLIRRLLRGEPVYKAHRSHAYQWLARSWRSHKLVTIAVTGTNLLWLLTAPSCRRSILGGPCGSC